MKRGKIEVKKVRVAASTALRLPEDLMQWLKHQAVDNKRSLNGELHHRLEQSRAAQMAAEEAATAAPGRPPSLEPLNGQ